MKSRYALILPAMLGVAVWWLYPGKATSQAQGRTRTSGSAAQIKDEPGGALAEQQAEPEASATIKALRAQIRQRDELLKGLLARAALDQQEPQTPAERRARAVQDDTRALDQRLASAPRDGAEAARLKGELEQLTARLPEDVKAEAACASTLCRLVLHGEDSARSQAAVQVAEGSLTVFGNTVVFATAEGESTMYLARDPSLLDLSTTREDPQ